jgi:hypothetical protein
MSHDANAYFAAMRDADEALDDGTLSSSSPARVGSTLTGNEPGEKMAVTATRIISHAHKDRAREPYRPLGLSNKFDRRQRVVIDSEELGIAIEGGTKPIWVSLNETEVRILEELPDSAHDHE